MNPNNQVYYSSGGHSSGRRRLIFIVSLIVIGIGALAYLVFGNNANNNQDDTPENPSTGGVTRNLSELSDLRLIAPSNMKDYIKRTNFTVDIGDYTTPDNSCNLQFGLVPAVELPGLTPEEIAATHLGTGAQTGAVGGEAREGEDLVLQAARGSVRYSMPTLDYTYTRDNVNYKASYSVVILVENRRVYVRRYCANANGPVSSQAFKKLNEKAKEIKIQPL
ncbi:MAG: hypothetical protein AAB834_02270 [Patescibacteria group bacterium]